MARLLSKIALIVVPKPSQPPAIPPRTYPQAPPSNLPVLLLGLARLFSWLTGGAAVLILIYHVRHFLSYVTPLINSAF